jgi:hypothetical protein
MKRVSLYLTEKQIKKAQSLGKQTGVPWASVVRQALGFYFQMLEDEGIKLKATSELMDGRVARSKLNASQPRKTKFPKLDRWLAQE